MPFSSVSITLYLDFHLTFEIRHDRLPSVVHETEIYEFYLAALAFLNSNFWPQINAVNYLKIHLNCLEILNM